ncbi:hypothetical protein HanPI659440_Chr15g0604961 [Helianthus annuus]|nr:hypothetical protein HanIR_Chr15g0767851 [Helianthus annuus]KAJ0694101.1 hypothetical protein HanPI659440_Chr15g0604961 [Helianthus annuus]
MWASSSSCCSVKMNNPQNPTATPKPILLQPPNGLAIQPTSSSRRRMLTVSILSSTSILLLSPYSISNTWAETEELRRYTDINEGFTLLLPKSWIKVEKAGATLLFQDPVQGSNNVGVVVTPVRLTNLADFGDPQFVANKLIQAEKRKESTKDVQLVSFTERQKGDIQVYEFEYKLDSTRGGLKTIFSAAFVASKKLYLLNIAHSQQPPLSDTKRMMLEKVVHSFDHDFLQHYLQCAPGVLNKHYQKLINCDTRLNLLSQQADASLDAQPAAKDPVKDPNMSNNNSSNQLENAGTHGYVESWGLVRSKAIGLVNGQRLSGWSTHRGPCE